jgi:hypothetical protein
MMSKRSRIRGLIAVLRLVKVHPVFIDQKEKRMDCHESMKSKKHEKERLKTED